MCGLPIKLPNGLHRLTVPSPHSVVLQTAQIPLPVHHLHLLSIVTNGTIIGVSLTVGAPSVGHMLSRKVLTADLVDLVAELPWAATRDLLVGLRGHPPQFGLGTRVLTQDRERILYIGQIPDMIVL